MEFLLAIGTGIVGKIVEYTVAPVARQVGYLIHYNRNLKKLQSQLRDLDAKREIVEHKIDQEERRERKVEAFVTNWLKDVNKITGEAKDILKNERHVKCLHGFCPNLKLHHQLSRKSTKLVQDVAELHEKIDFSSFAYEVNPEEVCSIPTKDIEVFDSRISVVKEIMDELRNSKICRIGVYGIGGVGKTTLVKQVYRQVTEHEKLFDDVVLVLDVKKNPSIERLQKEIAEKLGMDHRENETEAGRARHLCERIEGKKMLLILDDVWERIDLEAVGLPPLSTLKILLTSRSQRVLSSDMGTQKEFPLDVLDEKETWTLFEKMSGKIAEYTVPSVGYLIHYNRNLKKLQSQLRDLDAKRESVERKIVQEERRGRKIEAFVTNWLEDVNQITGEAKDILKDEHHVKCLHGFCPNLKLRNQLSRKSTKLVQDIAELHEKKIFSNFAYEVYPEKDSRISVVKEIMDELRNSKICMIGVYGIGGVGKTTLVKQVYRQVTEHEKLFDDVVLVLDVKKNPSIERLQKEIAEKLGMDHRENETEAGRARHLCDRIEGKKMLLILDDVWERIDLEAVGLPPLSTLKILLTSRSQIVLSSDMGTQKEFPLDVLDEKETWTLFEKMSGEIVKNAAIQSIATKVARRCGGLPVLVVIVARALKNGTVHEWNDALRRLKQLDGQGLTEKAYSTIEWSYSKLDNEELKSLFMLFGVVVGVANTFGIVDLWKYSMGLGLLKDVDTVGEAWDALCSKIEQLKDSCLLLESDDNTSVRMHDLVKDVAKRIASREQHILSLSPRSELKEWPNKDFCSKCTMISLDQCDIPEFPEVLQCQELTLFLLDNEVREIPCNLFREMKKLRVLDLTRFSIPSLPSSLQFLESLRTLSLDQCTLGDVTLIGQLQNLEILSFLKSKFKELPKEIGLLTRLRLLDLTGCSQLEVISPNVLSSLKRLEHLRMRNSFNRWEAGGVFSTERSNANLEELKNLPHLTELQLHIPNANILPPDLFTGCKLERFQICIGSVWKWDDVDEAINALKLQLTTSKQFDQGLEMLLKRTEDFYLEVMKGVYSSIVYQIGAKGSHLHVQNNVEFTSFLSIINGKGRYPNLTWLAVNDLNGLRFLLSSSMARSLAQLKHLQVSGCQIMEEIVSLDESDEEILDNLFCHLQDLELKDLPNLTKFCSRNYTELSNPSSGKLELVDRNKTNTACEEIEETDSTRNLDIVIQHFLFDNKVDFPNLKDLSINGLAKLMTIWNNQLSLESSKNLETIEIVSCDSLRSIFPASVARSLQQLRSLKVQNCGVEEIISKEEGVEKLMPDQFFPKLTCLEFTSLFQLERFDLKMPAINWPLKTLVLSDCQKVDIFAAEFSGLQKTHDLGNLRTRVKQYPVLFDKSSFSKLEVLTFGPVNIWYGRPAQERALFPATGTDGSLPHLRTLRLHGMEKFMRLWENTEPAAGSAFPKMETLEVKNSGLTNLELSAISFRNLTILEVTFCWRLQYLTTYSVARSLVQLITLKVDECKNMKEIFTSEGMGEDASKCEIEFSQLRSLELSDLVSLERFCSSNCRVKVPILGTLKVNWCPFKLKISSDKVLEVDDVQTESWSQSMSMLEQDNRRLREELRAKEGNSLPETPVVLALPDTGPSSSLTAKRTADLPVEVTQLNALLGIDLATPAVDKKSSSNHMVTELTAQLEARRSELIADSSQVEAECQEVMGREAELVNIRQLIKLLEARAATLEAR